MGGGVFRYQMSPAGGMDSGLGRCRSPAAAIRRGAGFPWERVDLVNGSVDDVFLLQLEV